MKVTHLRFDNTFLATLARLREKREQFQRLLADHPIRLRMKTRTKNPEADLRRQYKKVFVASLFLAAALIAITAVVLPNFKIRAVTSRKDQIVIHMEEIPQTRQVQRSLPRPAVPIEVGSEEVPDDVTIETTELVFDQVPIDLPPPPISAHKSVHLGEEEEPLEIWQVEKKPELTNELILEYPNLAEKAGLEGTVDVKLLVGSDGRVKKATVLRGKEIFHKATLKAVMRFVFKPAIQNGKPVPVWVVVPIEFKLEGLR